MIIYTQTLFHMFQKTRRPAFNSFLYPYRQPNRYMYNSFHAVEFGYVSSEWRTNDHVLGNKIEFQTRIQRSIHDHAQVLNQKKLEGPFFIRHVLLYTLLKKGDFGVYTKTWRTGCGIGISLIGKHFIWLS